MGTTEQATVTNIAMTAGATNVVVTVQNTGTSEVVINSAQMNGQVATLNSPYKLTDANGTVTTPSGLPTLAKGDNAQITVTLASALESGETYQIKLGTTKGNTLAYTQVCP